MLKLSRPDCVFLLWSWTKGERHNRACCIISGWIINMVVDAMVLPVIVEIHHSMPCFLQPNWLSIINLFTNSTVVLCKNRIKNAMEFYSCFPTPTTCWDMALVGICTKPHSASAIFGSELSRMVIDRFRVAPLHPNTLVWVLGAASRSLRVSQRVVAKKGLFQRLGTA